MPDQIPTDEEINTLIKQATEQGDYWSREIVLSLAKEIKRVREEIKDIEIDLWK